MQIVESTKKLEKSLFAEDKFDLGKDEETNRYLLDHLDDCQKDLNGLRKEIEKTVKVG